MPASCAPYNGGRVTYHYGVVGDLQDPWPFEPSGTVSFGVGAGLRLKMPDAGDYRRIEAGFQAYVRDLTHYYMAKALQSREWKDLVRNTATSYFRDHLESLVDKKIEEAIVEAKRELGILLEQASTELEEIAVDSSYKDLEAEVGIPRPLDWATLPAGDETDLFAFAYDWDAEEE